MHSGAENRSLDDLIGQLVVIDTPGPLVFIGHLEAYDGRGYWLMDADVHDRDEGHATNEQYVNDAYLLERSGVRHMNRRRVYVERSATVCISRLADVIADGQPTDSGTWLP